MSKTSALETLVELAASASDEAAQRLGRAISGARDADQKLELLMQYRQEYGQRYNEALKAGLSTAGYRNFRNFLDKLDAAIESQQQALGHARRAVDHERGQWQAHEKKRLSFDTLVTRERRAEEQRENRRDQKQMDEYAARSGKR